MAAIGVVVHLDLPAEEVAVPGYDTAQIEYHLSVNPRRWLH